MRKMRKMHGCYDRSGQPITNDEWSKLMNNPDYRRVAHDEPAGSRVLTIWLGLDHNWSDKGEPIIFETMVFGGPMNGEMQRYSTEQEALAGHKAIVDQLTGKA